MFRTIEAHFDGQVIVPVGPIELPTGRRLRVRIEWVEEPEPQPAKSPESAAESAEGPAPPFAWLLDLAVDVPDVPTDLAAQHDHYLYGTPKK